MPFNTVHHCTWKSDISLSFLFYSSPSHSSLSLTACPPSFLCVQPSVFSVFLGFWEINREAETQCSAVEKNRVNLPFKAVRLPLFVSPVHFARYSSTSLFRFLFCRVLPQCFSKTSSLTYTLPLCQFPSLAPLHPGKWLYPAEWLCKEAGTGGLSWAQQKGRAAKGKIKKRGSREKSSLESFSPGTQCPSLVQYDDSSSCSMYEHLAKSQLPTMGGFQTWKYYLYCGTAASVEEFNHIRASATQITF